MTEPLTAEEILRDYNTEVLVMSEALTELTKTIDAAFKKALETKITDGSSKDFQAGYVIGIGMAIGEVKKALGLEAHE